MVWAGGTQTLGRPVEGVLEIVTTNFDADAEEGDVVDLYANTTLFDKLPTDLIKWCTSTHATTVTDTVEFDVQGSYDNVDFTDIGTAITDADVDNGSGASERSAAILTDISALPYRYFKVVCTTVGAGNTLAMHWRLI